MKNVTSESHHQGREMPTIAEFSAAKIRESFDILGNKFNEQKSKAKQKMDVLAIEAELRKEASKIGKDIIKQIAIGIQPGVNENFIEEVKELLAKKEYLEDELAGGEKK